VFGGRRPSVQHTCLDDTIDTQHNIHPCIALPLCRGGNIRCITWLLSARQDWNPHAATGGISCKPAWWHRPERDKQQQVWQHKGFINGWEQR
jgi:hypothetical protein